MLTLPEAPERCQSLAGDLLPALDPVVFAQRAGFQPDPWQADVLRSSSPRMLLNCSRQSGKSTTTALLGLHTATYQPNALVLLLSPSQRQSAELFRKLADLYTATGATVPSRAESALRLELENGSRVISLPGTEATVRGYSGVDLLVIDEASRVEDPLYYSVRPMLAVSNGRLITMSTPYGKRGWWSDAWHSGSDRWERIKVTAEERESLGDWWFRQEYGCEFLDAESAAFSTADIQRAQVSEGVELWAL